MTKSQNNDPETGAGTDIDPNDPEHIMQQCTSPESGVPDGCAIILHNMGCGALISLVVLVIFCLSSISFL